MNAIFISLKTHFVLYNPMTPLFPIQESCAYNCFPKILDSMWNAYLGIDCIQLFWARVWQMVAHLSLSITVMGIRFQLAREVLTDCKESGVQIASYLDISLSNVACVLVLLCLHYIIIAVLTSVLSMPITWPNLWFCHSNCFQTASSFAPYPAFISPYPFFRCFWLRYWNGYWIPVWHHLYCV